MNSPKSRRKKELANLDRFSQPLAGETYFEEPQPTCQCEECKEDLYEGDWHYEAGDMTFCSKDCFIEWATVEFDGRSRILEGAK